MRKIISNLICFFTNQRVFSTCTGKICQGNNILTESKDLTEKMQICDIVLKQKLEICLDIIILLPNLRQYNSIMIENHHRSNAVSNHQLEMIHQAIFSKYDLDHNGFLEQEQVKAFMRDALVAGGNTENEADAVTKKFYREVDKNGDGKISKEEMIEILKYILQHKISMATRKKS